MKGFRVTTEEVKAELQNDKAIFFIDARNSTDWNASDIKVRGAVRIPTEELPQRLDQVPRGETVITY
jgi:rhodanese-related sulfurtransferase